VTPPFDLVLGGVARFEAEAPWAWRLLRRYGRLLPYREWTETRERRPTVGDARGSSPVVLAHADPEAYLVPHAARQLIHAIGPEERDLVLPVTNEPWTEEARFAPPFAYQTPALLEESARFLGAHAPAPWRAVLPRSPVFAVRRRVLSELPASTPLDEVPEEAGRRGFGVFVCPAAYLHRYGEMDAQCRRDLVSLIPPEAAAALEVGCARGETARALRESGVKRIVGIEPDEEDAAAAARLCDRVLPVPLEEVREEFPGQFDAVLFGDVLQHLIDPLAALERVRGWLSPRGVVVASVPNFGHWSLIVDLLEGRFDYVPYSILSGTQVRFFTRRTLNDLFEASGYRIETVRAVVPSPSPEGAVKLEVLASLSGASKDLDVAEFLVVARPTQDVGRRT
jgi:SAM-dependent methyltransferase